MKGVAAALSAILATTSFGGTVSQDASALVQTGLVANVPLRADPPSAAQEPTGWEVPEQDTDVVDMNKARTGDSSQADDSDEAIFKINTDTVWAVGNLSHYKKHTFNFVGKFEFHHKDRKADRIRALDFVKAHFKDNDLLRSTDPPPDWEPLGDYDVSLTPQPTMPPQPENATKLQFYKKMPYYAVMAQSWFTLCPRGDKPWSFRLYEAAMSRSICVIESLEQDVRDTYICLIPYKYVLANSSHFNATDVVASWGEQRLRKIIDYNYRQFILYQTYIDGGHNPQSRTKSKHAHPSLDECNSIVVED